MFIGYQNGKIVAQALTQEILESKLCVSFDEIEETSQNVIEKEGKLYLENEIPLTTKEEIEEKRKYLYQIKVDCLTAEISRLRDEIQTLEIQEKIADLISKRNEIVDEIKLQNPYPDEGES
ncbi:MAG: hypothetical protein EOM53_00505 [Alphaproteobacteria bacterium]|nr:hypothetical protein [Alphaproteobacteria bacterium]